MEDEKTESGFDLVYLYGHGRIEYEMRLTATAETDTSTTYAVDLVEEDEEGDFVRKLGDRLIEVPINPLYSDAQLADMRSKGIDTSFAADAPRPIHQELFDFNEGYYLFREWMRELGEPEKLDRAERRAFRHLEDAIHDAKEEAGRVVQDLIQRWRDAPDDDPDFTTLTSALIAYEQAGTALLDEADRWSRFES